MDIRKLVAEKINQIQKDGYDYGYAVADQIIPLVRADIAEWGSKYCYKHIDIPVPKEIGGGMVHKATRLRRRCRECWGELESGTFKAEGAKSEGRSDSEEGE